MKLKDYLKRNNITCKKFAEMVGVADAQIIRIINGQQNPSAHLTYRILETTKSEVTFEDLFNPNAPTRLKEKE